MTIASLGNAVNFGDFLSAIESHPGGASNATRGLFAGGYVPGNLDVGDFVIASTGNALDFGNFISSGNGLSGVASPTRAVFNWKCI